MAGDLDHLLLGPCRLHRVSYPECHMGFDRVTSKVSSMHPSYPYVTRGRKCLSLISRVMEGLGKVSRRKQQSKWTLKGGKSVKTWKKEKRRRWALQESE